MYKVIVRFKDLTDGSIYDVGDTFPHDDAKISKERIEELITNKNKIGKPVIEEVKEDVDDNDGAVSGTEELVQPESEDVARKVRNKRRKSDIS